MEKASLDQTDTHSLSVVVPVYNEQAVLAEFHQRLLRVLSQLSLHCEVLYVNDGSTDATLETLHQLSSDSVTLRLFDLSRNFGKEAAMTAGIDHAEGDAVIIIDADLQDPPELIPELVSEWLLGFDVVYAQRTSRRGESWMKKATAKAFYRVLHRLAGNLDIPRDTGDYRLMSRRAVNALKRLRENHRYMKGLYAWIGFRQKAVTYERDPRAAGTSKWNYWKLWNFSLEGITAFTTIPLRVATYIGFLAAAGAFGYGAFIIAQKILFDDPVPGFPSLIAVMTFLGGVQLLTLGVIGEYLGRMSNEVKHRPLYVVMDEMRMEPGSTAQSHHS